MPIQLPLGCAQADDECLWACALFHAELGSKVTGIALLFYRLNLTPPSLVQKLAINPQLPPAANLALNLIRILQALGDSLLNETSFVERRKSDWARLGFLCDKAERSVKSLSGEEFEELVDLYRKTSTDLAVVRTKSKNLQLSEFLNDLVARAYGTLYTEPRGSIGSAISQGVKLAAQTVRRRKWFIFASAALFFGSAIWSFCVISWRPATEDAMIPAAMKQEFDSWKQPFEEHSPGESAMMTGFYLSNNPRMAVIAGAIAPATFGFGTAYLLWFNGVMIGALAYELLPYHQTGRFLIWISPHGVPEMSGIIISGAAGFLIAWCLIHPGRKRRGQALRDAGKDIIVLLSTGAIMMFFAAPIEGYFSFNPRIPDGAKLAVAIVGLSAWLAFWSGYGKEEGERSKNVGSMKT